jgi:hypothetical protein
MVVFVRGEPICQAGLESSEIFDFGDGITLTPDCTQLREPMVTVTVEPSLQHIIRNWEGNTSEKTYHWTYVCEGENSVRVSQDYFANLPLGLVSWTYGPYGVPTSVSQILPVGTVCQFFGCYSYITRERDGSGSLNTTRYVFEFNTTSCIIDLDECEEGLAGCEQYCTDLRSGTNNSYHCSCRKGFALAEDLHNCTDVNECETGEHNCDQICTVDGDSGWFNCSCRDGFTMGEDGHTCIDIDECETMNGTMLCQTQTTGRECTNTPGSYQCLCQEGFEFSAQQNTCTDIDECATTNRSALCQNICNNTLGGYNCTCPRWYTEVGEYNCTAMDVCTELAVNCGGHSSCVNSPDSEEGYRCVCDSGYRQDGTSCSYTGINQVHQVFGYCLDLLLPMYTVRSH